MRAGKYPTCLSLPLISAVATKPSFASTVNQAKEARLICSNADGLHAPRRMQIEFSQIVQAIANRTGEEVPEKMIYALFVR